LTGNGLLIKYRWHTLISGPDDYFCFIKLSPMCKNWILVLITFCFFACTPPTKILNSWKDPNTEITNPGVHKIVVAALLYDQGVRRQVEDYMASLYPGVATQSYQILGGDSILTDEHGESDRLKSQGYDGIVLMKQVGQNTTQKYVPGTMPSYYTTWGGYWGYGWGPRYGATTIYNPGSPGYVETKHHWFVQVNVYSLISGKLIWEANTETTNPGGRIPLFTDVCNAVRAQMKKDGFLK
jgi:hypothetical protein